MNNEVCLQGGSAHVFIVRWELRAPSDQTDLTKGRDDSSEAVEEASSRGAPNPRARGRPTLGWGRPVSPSGGWYSPRVGCLPKYS